MRTIIRSLLLACVAPCALDLSAALAQPSTQADQAGGLEEIVVTARRVSEKLQDVPTAITAISAKELEEQQILSVEDIGNTVPSLNMQPQIGTPAVPQIAIRGISNGSLNPEVDSPIGIYVDGVYLGRAVGSQFDLADLQQIEVLRGPQGTLFGRNAEAGAINFITQGPSGHLDAHLETTFGNYNLKRVKATFDTPEYNGLSLRLTVLHTDQDGYVKNTAAGVTLDLPAPFGPQTSTSTLGGNDTNMVLFAARYVNDKLTIDYKFDFTDEITQAQPTEILGFDSTPNGGFGQSVFAIQPSITIFGESAGGITIVDLMASPAAQGLFQKAIVESGAFPRPMRDIRRDEANAPSAETLGRAFAESLGIDGADAAAALRALPVEKIAPGTPDELGQIQAIAAPIVDGSMFPQDGFARFARGRIAKIPLLIGSTGTEALVWAFGRDGKMATYPLLPFDAARFRAAFGHDSDDILATYWSRFGDDMAKTGPILATDMAVGAGSRLLADQSARRGALTFLYRFSAMPTPLRGLAPGAPHGTEVPYVFGTLAKLRNVGSGMTESDLALSQTVIDYWVSFAKTGDPNDDGRPRWPAHDDANGAFMDFTETGPVSESDAGDRAITLFEHRIVAGFTGTATK